MPFGRFDRFDWISIGALIYEVNRLVVLRGLAGGYQDRSFQMSSFHGLVEVLQPIVRGDQREAKNGKGGVVMESLSPDFSPFFRNGRAA